MVEYNACTSKLWTTGVSFHAALNSRTSPCAPNASAPCPNGLQSEENHQSMPPAESKVPMARDNTLGSQFERADPLSKMSTYPEGSQTPFAERGHWSPLRSRHATLGIHCKQARAGPCPFLPGRTAGVPLRSGEQFPTSRLQQKTNTYFNLPYLLFHRANLSLLTSDP